MLNSIRKLAKTTFAKLLLFILILSFVLWGVGDIIRSSYSSDVAEIKGIGPITKKEYYTLLQEEVKRLRAALGEGVDLQKAQIEKIVLNNIIRDKLLNYAARELNLHISNEMISQEIVRNGYFSNKDGKFDKNIFKQFLAESNLAEKDFFASVKLEILNRLVGTLITSGIDNSVWTKWLASYNHHQRVMEEIRLKEDTIKIEPATEEEITTYYNNNPNEFTSPEQRQIAYALISRPQVDISMNEAKQYYDNHKDEFIRPESFSFYSIPFASEKEAQDFVKLSEEGFDKAIEQVKHEKADHFFVQDIAINNIPSHVLEKLKSGGGIIETSSEWHLLKLVKTEPAKTLSFVEVKDKIIDQLKLEKQNKSLARLKEQIDDEIAGGSNLAAIASKFNFPLHRAGFHEVNKLNPILLVEALKLNKNEISDFLELSVEEENNLALLEVEEIEPAHLLSLDKVRGQIITKLAKDARYIKLQDEINIWQEEVNKGESFAKVANHKVVEKTYNIPDGFDITDPKNKNHWPQAGFVLSKGKITAPIAIGDEYIIALVKEVIINPVNSEELKTARQQVAKMIANIIMQEFLAGELKLHPVKLYER